MMDSPNIIALLRVSTDAQDVARQRADLDRMRAKFSITVARVLELTGVSGTATLEDGQVQQILKDLELSNIDGISVSALDRLFRPGKRYGQFAILDRFVDQGKKIWSMREGLIDPADDRGYDLCISAGGRAGAEWRELIRRTQNGRIEHLKKGYIDGGIPPYGYILVPAADNPRHRHFQIVPEQAEVMQQIFEWRRMGMPTYKIAKQLNLAGISSGGYRGKPGKPGRPGGRWSRQVVQQRLAKPVYMGEYRRWGVVAHVPAIIDRETWEDVQRITAESRTKHIGRPALKPYLLRSILWCGHCGRRCIVYSNGKAGQYRCGNFEAKPPFTRNCNASGIAITTMEAAAWDAIWSLLRDPETLIQLARAHFEEMQRPTETEPIEREIERLRRRISITNAQVQDEMKDFAEGRAEINEMKAQIAKLTDELRTAGKVVDLPPLAAAEADIRRMFDDPEVQEPTHFAGRRSILEMILDLRLVYADGDLTITGKIPMPEPINSTVYTETPGKKKCKTRVDAACISFASIPFTLKKRVA